MQSGPINAQLIEQKRKDQEDARKCLLHVITSVMFLMKQGLRGHDNDSGNLHQLLLLRSTDFPQLKHWMERKREHFFAGDCQNELL